MPVKAFISYSHADEKALDRLHKHLAMLLREQIIDAWTDHQIKPGDNIGATISNALEESTIFIGLISPDYLASNYCYEKEFSRARELAKKGKLRIVPIILEPCDWKSSPFAEYLVLPKDGKAVSEWSNPNNAYLDVVMGLRTVATQPPKESAVAGVPLASAKEAGRKIKVQKDFDAVQRFDFAKRSYEIIKAYFAASCTELNDVGEGNIKARFQDMDQNAFTCTVVNRQKRGNGEAFITVRNNQSKESIGDISFVYKPNAPSNTANGWISVENDEYNMFLKLHSGFTEDKALSPEQVANTLWEDFVKQAGVEYD